MTVNLTEKGAEEMNKQFTEKELLVALTNMKLCSTYKRNAVLNYFNLLNWQRS